MSNRIRILFAIGEMSGGGSQRQMIGILQRLDRNRFQPFLYLISPGGELLPEVPPDVPIFIFRDRNRPSLWVYHGQAHRARVRDLATALHEQRIDFLYDRTYHMTLIAAGATRHRPTPRVSTIVTDPQLDFETNPERFRFVKRILLRRAYQSADRVVAVSEGVREAAIKHYRLSSDRTIAIHNFFDIERIDRLAAEPLPSEEQRRPDQFEIVAAGRLHPQKGFLNLLRATEELVHRRNQQPLHVRILGTGPQESELRAFITQHSLQKHVTLAGFRTNPLPYYKQADLFCLSSLYEGMPNALVEAMVCGTAVVATDCPSGPREVLADGRFGRLVAAGDWRPLADVIEDAVSHPDAGRLAASSARRHIEQEYSPVVGMQRLESLFAEMWQDNR